LIGTFKQGVTGGELRMHPIVGRLVDKDVLEKLGVRQVNGIGLKPSGD
jgi:hypothetical protein